jgi:hypothetical protein
VPGYIAESAEWVPGYIAESAELVPGYIAESTEWVPGYIAESAEWVQGYITESAEWVQMCEKYRPRSLGTADQNLHYSLLDSLGNFWPRSKQCRSRSNDTNVSTDLDLDFSPTW